MSKKKTTKTESAPDKSPLLPILIAALPFLNGIFYEWQSAIVSIALLVYLAVIVIRHKELVIKLSFTLYATGALVLFYGISVFWAKDSGMALFGFVKFLPLLLFVLALFQARKNARELIVDYLPYSGAIMTVFTLILSRFELAKGHLIVSGRLGGLFEYPNVFAMFLLICLITVLFDQSEAEPVKGVKKFEKPLLGAIDLIGIALSGSRTVMVLLGVTAIVYIVWVKGRRQKLIAAGVCSAGAVAAGIYLAVTGNFATVGRVFTSFTDSSTFNGRLLYFRDALPVILKHPFGLGYYGYYYSQGQFQTGVYSVIHIHNDLLQILVDVGWIPAILVVIMFILALRKCGAMERVILIMTGLHVLFDFDMQFVSVAFILLAVIVAGDKSKEISIKAVPGLAFCAAALLAACAFSAVIGTASFMNYLNRQDSAVKVWPWYTEAEKVMLLRAPSADEMERVAGIMLKNNPDNSLANSAMARVCFSRGDILNMVSYKEKSIANNKYSLSEYLDYFDMLKIALALYLQNEDYQSAQFCLDKLLEIPDEMKSVEDGTSPLGWKIDDKPELTLPQEYSEYIDLLRSLTSQ